MAGSEPSAGAGGAERPRCDDELDRGLRWLTRPDGVQIVVARNAGYCYGVERALGITAEALDHARKPVASLGPIIHNPSVVGELGRRGVEVVEEVGAAQGGTLIVRTHGVAPDVLAAAEARGIDVIDATCPFVAVAQRKASDLQDAGYTVVILGEHDHPEVAGLAGFAGPGAVVVEDAADLPCDHLRRRRVGVVVQTTQTRDNLAKVASTLAPVARELLIHNTICDATEKRQSAACDLAAGVDAVVVVGGRNSANTARLAQLCRAIEERTHHVESAAELRAEWFSGARRIGVTAGASTPDAEIEATVQKLWGFGDG
jgi:4-hydroxy-3-methylbut-2-enyl diphosphate reductase